MPQAKFPALHSRFLLSAWLCGLVALKLLGECASGESSEAVEKSASRDSREMVKRVEFYSKGTTQTPLLFNSKLNGDL